MASTKNYWKSEAELNSNDPAIQKLRNNEFVSELPVDQFLGNKETLDNTSTNRRDFLKFVGFSTAAATLAACEGPVIKTIPYVVQPEEITPGIANFYATSIANGYDFASVLVKTAEGRPIKIESNREAAYFSGANARVHASVLSLYDSARIQGPLLKGAPVSWADLDKAVIDQLNATKASGQKVVLMTPSYASPSTAALIAQLQAVYPQVIHVAYDAVSKEAALTAYERVYGQRALADYDFSKADVIVSIGADFLGDWQGGGYAAGYAQGRVPSQGRMSRHYQVESLMSLSGANADYRLPATHAEQKRILAAVFSGLSGASIAVELTEAQQKMVDAMVSDLRKAGSAGVVVSGLEDVDAQLLVLAINQWLSSTSFDPSLPRTISNAQASDVNALLPAMAAGQVGMLLVDGVNPVYSLPNGGEFAAAMQQVPVTVVFATTPNETTEVAQYVGAANHYLESWGDMSPKVGQYALAQPVIRNLFDSRQIQTSLLNWLGVDSSYYDYVRAYWENNILGTSSWSQALHDGYFTQNTSGRTAVASIDGAASAASLAASKGVTMELVLYTKTGMGDGQEANNPWLQEFPDPISRVSWDNYATFSKADAQALGIVNKHAANGGLDGSYVTLTVGNTTLKVPALIQPGQAPGTIGLALGYGRKSGLKELMQVGVNAYGFYQAFQPVQEVSVALASGMHEFASVQLQNTLMGRGDIIKETTLEIFNTAKAEQWNEKPMVSLNHQEVAASSVDLWDSFDRSIGHHFNLSIDLNACTGCGACVIACHAENNVPVVGKAEIRRSRDMHWLRIDRYYSSETSFEGDNQKKDDFNGLFGDSGSLGGFGQLEDPSANPQVAFQPVMCQHCNHAPCETVCPVAATSHSRQGQNHMAYNRCVGTRYCANNCPYKVRRFNWFLYNNNDEFDFHMNNDLGKMVLNPDVNVRSRGVMEKCSMCIQKTQKTILDAKREGRTIKDGEFQTECSAACNTGAKVFGDVNDPNSQVTSLSKSERVYHLLEHVGTKPNVFYHVKVRNTTEA